MTDDWCLTGLYRSGEPRDTSGSRAIPLRQTLFPIHHPFIYHPSSRYSANPLSLCLALR
jgi:hypothetical protein